MTPYRGDYWTVHAVAVTASVAIHAAVLTLGADLLQTAPEPLPHKVEARFKLTPPPPEPEPPEPVLARPIPPPPKQPVPPPPEPVANRPEPPPPPPEPPQTVAEPPPPPNPPPPPPQVVPPEPLALPNPPEPEPEDVHFPQTRPDYTQLVSSVRDGIDAAKRYPRMARRAGYEGRTLLKFRVLKDGSIEGIEVIESSHFDMLDAAAVRAVERAAPFIEQAKQIEEDHIVIILPVIFRLR